MILMKLENFTSLLRLNQGRIPAQFIGPKWLTALHNIALCPVMESAAMLSPLVMRDYLAGQGEALRLFQKKSPVTDADMNSLIKILRVRGICAPYE